MYPFIRLAMTAIGFLICMPCWGQSMTSNIAIQIKANRSFELSERRIEVTKGIDVFGRSVENQRVRIDSETRGLSDVFIWIRGKRRESKQKDQEIVLANGNYVPHALVAPAGKRLKVSSIDNVADRPNSVFATDPRAQIGGAETVFMLEKLVDRPVKVESAFFPWIESHVFVEFNTTCSVTNRLGVCQLPINELPASKFLDVYCWHPHFKELVIETSDKSVEFVKPGQFRILAVDKDHLVQQVTLNAVLEK